MNTTVTLEHLGPEATDSDLDTFVRALRVRGYETEHGMFNGTVEPVDIPDAIWQDCLNAVGEWNKP